MALPITINYTFGNATTSIPLSNLDTNFSTLVNAINGIGNGTNSLANVSITGGTINATGLITTAAAGIKFSDGTTLTTAPAGATGPITSSGYTQSTARILGRTTASTGAIEEITVGSGLLLSAGSLTATSTGGATLIASGTTTSGTAVTVTSIAATYAYLVFQITGLSFTTNAVPLLRPSTNNGTSYDSTAANFFGIKTNIDNTPTVTTSVISQASFLEAASFGSGGTYTTTVIIQPYQGGTYSRFSAVAQDSNGNTITVFGSYKNTSAINALQLSGGTFDAGSYALYGVA